MMQEKTKQIIIDDQERVRAYEKIFHVPMPHVTKDGDVDGLPSPYPRVVNGIERSGYRIWELSQKAKKTGIPIMNPILGRNTADETYKESLDMYKAAEDLGLTIFHFVHSEATRHIDPLDGAELIEESRGKGGITPGGERELVQIGGGTRHPMRINATGDTPHLSIINGLIAGFDGTDIGPVIHVHFGGRGIKDYKTKVINGYRALQICAENNMFVQTDSHKHLNNIGGTDGMALAMCLLSEGLAVLAGLPKELSAIQMNISGINLFADLALMRAFQETMLSGSMISVPETFQNPPPDLIAEQAHFARMAISARLGGADFYRPKAAESVGIPTGKSMGKAIWATHNVFTNTAMIDIQHPYINKRKEQILTEAMAVLTAVLQREHMIMPQDVTADFWRNYDSKDLIDLIVTAGKKGVMDAPRAGGWDLKRAVRTHRDIDGIRRYVPGYGPTDIDEKYLDFTRESVEIEKPVAVNKKTKIILATVGADAHVVGINLINDTLKKAGFEVIYLRGMNVPETVAEVAAESKAQLIGVSNLLGLGLTLYPRVDARMRQLDIRNNTALIAGGRITEKEEEVPAMKKKIKQEGTEFLGVDAYFGPGSDPQDVVKWVIKNVEEKIAEEV